MTTKIGTAAHYIDLITQLDAFLTATGHAWGATFTGTGNGRLRGPGGTTGGYIGTASSVAETITITFTTATAFSVVGSSSGALGAGVVGTDFASTKVAFRIVAGSTAFVAGDLFRVNTSPKWARTRLQGCPDGGYRSSTYSGGATAFFNDVTTTAITATTLPQSIIVEMAPVATKVMSFTLFTGNSTTQTPRDFNLAWSDDGVSYTTAQSWAAQTWTVTFEARTYILSADPGAHRFWRLTVTASNSGTTTQLAELRLYADAVQKQNVSSRIEFAWKAPGNDGTKEIYLAGFGNSDSTTDTYDIGFRGFRFWPDLTSSVLDIPDHSGTKYLYLAKTPIAYWFIANGARMIVAWRISGVYYYAYLGFGLPYESPDVHPFPLLIGGNYVSANYRWDNTTPRLRNPCDPNCESNANGDLAALAAFFPSGGWEQIANRYSASVGNAEGLAAYNVNGKTWPYSLTSDAAVFTTFLRENIDGSRPIIPVVITYNDNTSANPAHTWGEFDGVYWTSGFGTASEATVRDGAIDLLILQNGFRNAINSYSAIALD